MLCLWGAPLPPYIKEQGGGRRPREERRARRGSPTPTGSRTPPFLVGVGEGKGEGERRKGAPPSLVLFGLGRGGARGHLLPPSLFSLKAQEGPITPRGVPVTSRYSGKMPISPGTIPMSKYRLPIYRSLCIDHFETPRHAPDLIWDSELLWYIKTHKLII